MILVADILTDVWLPDSLDCGKILIWFYCGLKSMPCCEWTMRKLCEAQQNYDSQVDRVVEIVKAAVGGQSPPDVFIRSCNEGIDFVTSYLINFQVGLYFQLLIPILKPDGISLLSLIHISEPTRPY